jgi:hypothetical protein
MNGSSLFKRVLRSREASGSEAGPATPAPAAAHNRAKSTLRYLTVMLPALLAVSTSLLAPSVSAARQLKQ